MSHDTAMVLPRRSPLWKTLEPSTTSFSVSSFQVATSLAEISPYVAP